MKWFLFLCVALVAVGLLGQPVKAADEPAPGIKLEFTDSDGNATETIPMHEIDCHCQDDPDDGPSACEGLCVKCSCIKLQGEPYCTADGTCSPGGGPACSACAGGVFRGEGPFMGRGPARRGLRAAAGGVVRFHQWRVANRPVLRGAALVGRGVARGTAPFRLFGRRCRRC